MSTMADMAAPADQQQRMSILLCIVTNGRPEASLVCAISMLRLQTMLMTAPERIAADMHFVPTIDDAMNLLHQHPTARGAAVMDSSLGFDPEFPTRAMRSGLPVVVASYPLPEIDWERVKRQPKNEESRFWGNKYSVTPSGRIGPNGYAHVTDAKLGIAWVAKEVVTGIVERNPGIVALDGSADFALTGVHAGKRHDGHRRFLELFGGDVWADLEHPGSSTGPIEFGGCVGMRHILR